VMVDFSTEVMAALTIGDRIQITAVGAGLALPQLPDVKVMNCSPPRALLEKWELTLDSKKRNI
jgi:hypothetical protein